MAVQNEWKCPKCNRDYVQAPMEWVERGHCRRCDSEASNVITKAELECLDELARVAGMLRAIVVLGAVDPDAPTEREQKNRVNDTNELVAHIHVLQQAVMSNAAARAVPGEFRLLGGTL